MAAGTLNAAFLMGLVFYGFGVFIQPLTHELGWATTAVAFGFSLQRMEAGLFAPIAGYLIDRFSPRKVALVGVALNGAGFVIFARIESIWEFYAASLLIALGQSMATMAPFTTAIMRWFQRYRARAVSLMMAGTGLGTISIYPLVALVERVGWRAALLYVACVVWAIGALSASSLRSTPERYGLRPDGQSSLTDPMSPTAAEPALGGFSTAQALRSSAFWLLLGSGLVFGFSNLGWVVLQYPALESKGFGPELAGLAVAIYGLASVGTRVLMGWMADRLGRPLLFVASFGLQALGLGIFAMAESFWGLIPYYVVYSVGHAAYVVTSQTIVADYFGTFRFATIRGWMGTLSSIGGATGPVLGALVFDATSSYAAAFVLFSLVILTGIPLALLANRLRPRVLDTSFPSAV